MELEGGLVKKGDLGFGKGKLASVKMFKFPGAWACVNGFLGALALAAELTFYRNSRYSRRPLYILAPKTPGKKHGERMFWAKMS